ncbi:hypothetical protein AGMMS49928_18510 [Spirochaetia bacterium]|nr:hypothetical protein AGMMS49928_18510 [Spirochaetia bacterium]
MRNVYEYIDPDYIYTDPATGVLRNLHDITNQDDLLFFESSAATKRINELIKTPVKINASGTLLAIHRHMSGTINGEVEKLAMLILELIDG